MLGSTHPNPTTMEPTESAPNMEEEYRLLVEGVHDCGICLLDPTGRVASWNPGAERIDGYRADEIIGHPFSRFFQENDVRAGRPLEVLRIATEQGRFEEENWRVRKDGTQYWGNVIIVALRGPAGNLRGFGRLTR